MPNIEAHITGTVWKIECQVGDTIAEDDTVVILESMKMEMPVEAEDPILRVVAVLLDDVADSDLVVQIDVHCASPMRLTIIRSYTP
mgnify:CR=1 FL=1